MPQSKKIAERLLVHARLCRELAEVNWNEETALKLRRMADRCERQAASARETRSKAS
jgi:hypothetical protein